MNELNQIEIEFNRAKSIHFSFLKNVSLSNCDCESMNVFKC